MVWGVSSLGIQQDQLSHYPGSTLSNRKSGVATGSCTAAMVNKHLLNDCLVIKTAAVNFSLTICLSGMRVTIMVHTGCTVFSSWNSRDQHIPSVRKRGEPGSQLRVKLRGRHVAVFSWHQGHSNIWKTLSQPDFAPGGALAKTVRCHPVSSCDKMTPWQPVSCHLIPVHPSSLPE